MQKKIVIFEGFGSAGKSSLIQTLKRDLETEFKIEILDNQHPNYSSILFSASEEFTMSKGKYAYFCFRWTRLYLFFNFIINSKSNLFFFDRGILTNYIYGKEDNVPQYMIDELVNGLLLLIEQHNLKYKTIFVDCKIEIANARCNSRIGIDIKKKLERNLIFAPYLTNIAEYFFINDLFITDSSGTYMDDYERLLSFILD